MAKDKTVFTCQQCGVQSPKWLGKCPSCGEWNSFVEEVIRTAPGQSAGSGRKRSPRMEPQLISEIRKEKNFRFHSGDAELDRVLGGGIVPGSVILIGGDPGIGKSTLMLQIALKLKDKKILYVSGEESATQIKMRAERIGSLENNCFILPETRLDDILGSLDSLQPGLVIVDSIQTVSTSLLDAPAGSVSQLRQCTGELIRYAKENNIPVFLIGHINKEGSLAGPKVLEHMVDTVLQFEGDRYHAYRLLRSLKNRFGSTYELGIYEMQGDGLKIVDNPSELLLSQREGEVSGIAVGVSLEGIRPLLIEVQALVSTATFGTPQRSTTGFDFKRLNMLIAVLEKRAGFRLGIQDVFLNITGGVKVNDPSLDLSVAMAVISSYQDIPVDHDTSFSAEIGLSGELRAVNQVEKRISEAEKQGFRKIVISKYQAHGFRAEKFSIEVISCGRLDEVTGQIFGNKKPLTYD